MEKYEFCDFVIKDQLGSLLRTAESLRVKGLAQASSGGNGDSGVEHPSTLAPPSQQQPVSLTSAGSSSATIAASAPPLPCQKTTPTPTTTPPHSQSHPGSTFSPPPPAYHSMGQAPPPPALLPLFQNAALLSAAITTVWIDEHKKKYDMNNRSTEKKKKKTLISVHFARSPVLALVYFLGGGKFKTWQLFRWLKIDIGCCIQLLSFPRLLNNWGKNTFLCKKKEGR